MTTHEAPRLPSPRVVCATCSFGLGGHKIVVRRGIFPPHAFAPTTEPSPRVGA